MDIIPLLPQVTKNLSYLRARDPSIGGVNVTDINKIRINLGPEFPEASTLSTVASNDAEQEEDNLIKIYLRIKNGTNKDGLYNIENDNTITCKVIEGSHAARHLKAGDSVKNMYTFTRIFHPTTTQSDIFNRVIKPKMLRFINGCNSTLLTYGASGSGKTFTVIGTDEDPGLVPRALEYLFKTIKVSTHPRMKPLPNHDVTMLAEYESKREKSACANLLNTSHTFKTNLRTYMAMQSRLSSEPAAFVDNDEDVICEIWVSYAEIYNEYIYDLLQQEPGKNQKRKKLRLGCSNGQTYIKDLSSIYVSSGLEAFQIIQYGIHNINYAATRINSHSSRSHSIFTIKLVQMSKKDGGIFISNFNFCDLAGSERLKKTENVGDRLKESNNINSSLLVLGRCISAIRHSQSRNSDKIIPFRESKLTQLFQNALAGNEDIVMIVNVSLSKEMFDETQHVLKFAAIAKEISVESQQNKPKKVNRFSQYLERDKEDLNSSIIGRYRNAVAYLELELETQRIEYEESTKQKCELIINGYKEIIVDKEAFWKQKIQTEINELEQKFQDRIELLKTQYEAKMNKMQDDYEDEIYNLKMQELKHKNQVIEIDDSSSDDDDQNNKFHDSLGDGMTLRQQNKILQAEKQELIATLNDAEIEYREAIKIISQKENLIMKLSDEIKDLRYEVKVLRSEMHQYSEETDEIDMDMDSATHTSF